MKTPAQLYRRSTRRFSKVAEAFEYPKDYFVRSVQRNGCIKWNGTRRFVSEALAGEKIGLEKIDDRTIRLWYCEVAIAEMDNLVASSLRPTASAKTPPKTN